jgi:hypothetical protein
MGPETAHGLLCIKPPMQQYDLYGPCVMLLMWAASIAWASGRGLGPGNRDFLGPVKWHRAERRVQVPPTACPRNGCCPHQKHYARKRINHRRINSSPWD